MYFCHGLLGPGRLVPAGRFYLKPGEKKRTKQALASQRNRKKRARDPE
jgi:hypothetical protein